MPFQASFADGQVVHLVGEPQAFGCSGGGLILMAGLRLSRLITHANKTPRPMTRPLDCFLHETRTPAT
jgi:hypothetical protein